MRSSVRRPFGVVAAGLALALGATACAESDASPSVPTVTIQPSSYVTRPVVTTTSTVPGTIAEGNSPVEQLYTVRSGDYLSLIAGRFEVSMDEIVAYNDWSDGTSHGLFAGDVVKIPPGAVIPGEESETESTQASTDDSDPQTTTDAASTGPCDPGTYEIEADEYPILIAENFDVTLEALAEANGWTPPDYADFPPAGTEINIPPGADCT